MQSSSQDRLVHIYKSGHWQTTRYPITNQGCSVNWNGLVYFCRDITFIVGAPALLYIEEDRLIVFDMSASHLCPKQLKRIQVYAVDSKRRCC